MFLLVYSTAFSCMVVLVFELVVARLCMFASFLLLNKHSFSISPSFCLFIGHPLAGCACFCSSGCSISTQVSISLRFLVYWPSLSWFCMFSRFMWLNKHSFSVFMRFCMFIGRLFVGCACLRAFCCSISTPLAFLSVFACLSAVH